jgi:hypothetical protein
MAKLIPSPFCRIEFKDDEEQARAALLSSPTKDWIQYLMSIAAQKRLNLSYDLANPMEFMQVEAALKGEITTYQYLLEASTASAELLATLNSPPTSN